MPRPDAGNRRDAGVQSLHRALDLVEVVAARGGHLTIGEIAAATDVPLPTVHRLLATLVDRGYMRQMSNRRYALGFRLVPLGATASSMVGADTEAVLGRLVDALGETANLAILSGSHAEYVAQVPSRHTMRMFTEVGRQVDLHCTGVGKALLAQLDDARVRTVVRRVGAGPADRAHPGHRGGPARRPEPGPGPRLRPRRAGAGGGRPLRRRPRRSRPDVLDGGLRVRPGHPDDRRADRPRRPAAPGGRPAP